MSLQEASNASGGGGMPFFEGPRTLLAFQIKGTFFEGSTGGYAHFAARHGWREVKAYRDLSPSLPCLLEVDRLSECFELRRVSDFSEVFLATPLGESQVVMACSACHVNVGFKESGWAQRLEDLLLDGLDELENAKLALEAAEGRLYLHLLPLQDIEGTELYGLLEAFTSEFAARHGALLQGEALSNNHIL